MNKKSDYIGVFDSGVGGISVLRQLKKILPNERFLYYGDSANAPYGKRTTEQVKNLTLSGVEKMTVYGLKALVIACNTATSAAIQALREKYSDLIVIGIEPALKPAVDRFPNGRIGVMATNVTLREEKFDRLLQRFADLASIEKIPAPGLVELVEKGMADCADELLKGILLPYRGRLDALVLGCTHYPFASNAIRRVLGTEVMLFDGGEGTARETKRRLEQENLIHEGSSEILWINSAHQEKILTLCQALFDQP